MTMFQRAKRNGPPLIWFIERWVRECEANPIPSHNKWISNNWARIYLRYGPVFVEGEIVRPALQIANITVSERRRGQGYYVRLLQRLINLCRVHNIPVLYVENVMEPRFAQFHAQMGFHVKPGSNPPCFYCFVEKGLPKLATRAKAKVR